jgi:hypothetical protein
MGEIQEVKITPAVILIATIIMALIFTPLGFTIAIVLNQATEQKMHDADRSKWEAIITLYDRTPVPAKAESSGDQEDERAEKR